MTEDDAAVLRQTLIKETVGLAAIAMILWYFGPGKLWMSGIVHRAKTMMGAQDDVIDTKVVQFRAEVSRWDHEQAAQKDRRSAPGGGCGCG
jgi:hypothetical protein